jgi:two-component system cell cycle response regulator
MSVKTLLTPLLAVLVAVGTIALAATWVAAIGVLLLLGLFLLSHVRLQRARETSRRESLVDALTGLGNRRRLFQDLAVAQRQGSQALLALCDLDGFKAYNDRFGHQAGDELLETLGIRLHAAVDGIGAAYRMGGDEFCLLLLGELGETDVARIAEQAIGEDGAALGVRFAYGVAALGPDAVLDEAMRLADQRMYRDKATRRDERPVAAAPRAAPRAA